MAVTVDLTKIEKQADFFSHVIEAAYGDNPYRYFFTGGAIRGSKTFGCLASLVVLCKLFPGSKWYVIRKSFTRLEETTIPSMIKMLGRGANVKWHRSKSNYHVEFLKTGSHIFFAGEDFDRDPKLDWMLGLECNGFFLEQTEELQEITLEMSISRAGTWIIDPMPSPLILASFNPTRTWVRERIHLPHIENRLEAPYYFQELSPKDSPFVIEEQWKNWQNMDPQLYAQFIEGSWDFEKPANAFAYAFDEKKHHADVGYNSDEPLFVSFDFNVEPIVCLLEQHGIDWAHTIKEYRLLNSDIWALTDHIVVNHADAFFMITGDATGRSRQAISKGNRNYYQVIKDQLALGTSQIKVPRGNPSIRNTRVLTNALFAKHPNFFINTKTCPHLTIDLNTVEVNQKGEIATDKDKRIGHLMAAHRYSNWTWHRDFLDKSLYQYLGNE